jgi:hypothetical protein
VQAEDVVLKDVRQCRIVGEGFEDWVDDGDGRPAADPVFDVDRVDAADRRRSECEAGS